MSKAKSKIFNAMQNPLAGRGHGRGSLSGLSVSFYTQADGIVMRTKPKSPPHTSPAQVAQQELWKDGDCMWKARTRGQRILWSNFYGQEYRAGRTIVTETTKETEAGRQIPARDMGQCSLFMSHALRFDLLAYLENYLRSSWIILTVQETEEAYEVTAGLTNPDWLIEASVFQEPKPVRGFH